jgi:photosystem II stability/assembly factor-like uncharacterized protein
MKKIYFLLAILLLTGSLSKINAWNQIPSGTTAGLYSVCFVNSDTGFVAGSGGTILKTTDAGATWTLLNSGSTAVLRSIYFVNDSVGYVVGGNTVGVIVAILKTTNGGLSWTTQTSPVTKRLNSVFFLNETIGYAVGFTGTILKTIDGGANWISQISGTTKLLNSVYFTDINTGYAVGQSGTILKTTDGGANWMPQTSGTTTAVLNSVQFVNSTTGYVVGSTGIVLKTTNGGNNWITQISGTTTVLNAVFFINDSVGYTAGRILKTSNSGMNWHEQSVYNNITTNDIYFTNDLTGYAVGDGGIILKTNIGGGYSGYDNLDVNNINARIDISNSLFWDMPNGGAHFEVPKGSGKNSLFAGALWLGGIDQNGQLHLAAEKYRQNGDDFFPGPIMDSVNYKQEQEKWNRIWKVTSSEISNHISNWSNTGYIMPKDIAEWPGNGNTSIGQTQKIAPYFDNNNDGLYTPQLGDYPIIKGDQALFFVFNDSMGIHTEGDGKVVGVEIRAMAYAFDCPDDSAFWNTMFLNYEILNRSQNTYDSSFVGFWSDMDLGDANDDFVGCDVQRGSCFIYNADDADGTGQGNSYGANPPAQSITFLGGPYSDADGSDFGSSGIVGGCDESINGLNYNDGIIDNERLGMSKFLYFNNSSAITGDPQHAEEYYNYLQGRWRDGTPMTYGGTSYGGSVTSSFVFPYNTDPCGWGTGGVPQGTPYWTEMQAGNTGADRRGVVSTGPYTMEPGEINEIDIAFVFGRDFTNPNSWAAIPVVQQRIDSIRKGFIHNITPCGSFQNVKENNMNTGLKIYPNPASSYFTLSTQNNNENKTVSVFTMDGVLVKQQSFSDEETQVETSGLSSGLYIVEVKTSTKSYYRKVIVSK